MFSYIFKLFYYFLHLLSAQSTSAPIISRILFNLDWTIIPYSSLLFTTPCILSSNNDLLLSELLISSGGMGIVDNASNLKPE